MKYFKFVDKRSTVQNIAYMKKTCEDVSLSVRRNLSKRNEYEAGEKLVCRKYLNCKFGKFHVNYEYKIIKIQGYTYTILEETSDKRYELNYDLIKKHFIHSYCRTCHSFQGSSLNGRMTIFDWSFYFVDRKWLYTAITRATELKHVLFYNCGNGVKLQEKILDEYCIDKMKCYMRQDRQAGREITDNYVNIIWFGKQFGKACPSCGDCFRFDTADNTIFYCKLTADRIDNDEGHHLNNIVPLCRMCDMCKGNR